jgi:hypothetical protein
MASGMMPTLSPPDPRDAEIAQLRGCLDAIARALLGKQEGERFGYAPENREGNHGP